MEEDFLLSLSRTNPPSISLPDVSISQQTLVFGLQPGLTTAECFPGVGSFSQDRAGDSCLAAAACLLKTKSP